MRLTFLIRNTVPSAEKFPYSYILLFSNQKTYLWWFVEILCSSWEAIFLYILISTRRRRFSHSLFTFKHGRKYLQIWRKKPESGFACKRNIFHEKLRSLETYPSASSVFEQVEIKIRFVLLNMLKLSLHNVTFSLFHETGRLFLKI